MGSAGGTSQISLNVVAERTLGLAQGGGTPVDFGPGETQRAVIEAAAGLALPRYRGDRAGRDGS